MTTISAMEFFLFSEVLDIGPSISIHVVVLGHCKKNRSHYSTEHHVAVMQRKFRNLGR